MRTFVFILVCFVLVCTCLARVITVDDDGPSDFNNIQAAINDANDWDTVIVADGIYTGTGNRDIDFGGKAITVRSENGPTNCIIDCNGSSGDPHRGFIFQSGEDGNSVVDGFSILGGYQDVGGAIRCKMDINPTIINCIFSGNTATLGGAIYCYYPDYPKIINCTFSNNTSLDSNSGAVHAIGLFGTGMELRDCIVWGNPPTDKCGVYAGGDTKPGGYAVNSAYYSILQADWDSNFVDAYNTVVADPCFADPCGGDYHLQSAAGRWDANSESWFKDANTSVAIDGGDPNSDWSGELWPHGRRINMGAYGGTAEASMSLSSAGNIANLNNDGNDIVDYNDLALFVDKWLYDEVLLAEDLDRDGDVETVDFSILAKNWLSGQ